MDNKLKIVEVVKSYLENSGYEVYCAYTRKQEFDQFDSVKPSLMILDWMLPDTSDEDICKIIRQKIETEPQNPRFILTVHGIGCRFGENNRIHDKLCS